MSSLIGQVVVTPNVVASVINISDWSVSPVLKISGKFAQFVAIANMNTSYNTATITLKDSIKSLLDTTFINNNGGYVLGNCTNYDTANSRSVHLSINTNGQIQILSPSGNFYSYVAINVMIPLA